MQKLKRSISMLAITLAVMLGLVGMTACGSPAAMEEARERNLLEGATVDFHAEYIDSIQRTMTGLEPVLTEDGALDLYEMCGKYQTIEEDGELYAYRSWQVNIHFAEPFRYDIDTTTVEVVSDPAFFPSPFFSVQLIDNADEWIGDYMCYDWASGTARIEYVESPVFENVTTMRLNCNVWAKYPLNPGSSLKIMQLIDDQGTQTPEESEKPSETEGNAFLNYLKTHVWVFLIILFLILLAIIMLVVWL